jgi:D-glycero-D-manno-heptose 1,7-bisphosphate phosphatase
MLSIKQAVILAGGLGTRLKPLTDFMPKPMISIHSRPFLEYLLSLLKDNGIHEVVILLGYLHEKISGHFGDGSDFGLRLKYSIGDVSFETGTRIKHAAHLLDDHFLLMYCDNYWPLNLKALTDFHIKQGTCSTVTVYTNKDGLTKNNTFVDHDGYVIKYDKSRKDPDLNGVEIGFFILSREILQLMPNSNFSFESVVLPQLILKRQLSGYLTDHRYYSIGSFERIEITEKFLQPRKIVFLDRDGVINRKAPKAEYVKNWDEFEFLPGVIEAIQLLSQNAYEIYLVTNQAGIARGIMSEADLNAIHENMKKELGKAGIGISGIYYCPHGWDDGCDCRKPKPRMLFKAANDHHLNLTKAIFIGDDERDAAAGKAAGCRTILVNPQHYLLRIVRSLLAEEE